MRITIFLFIVGFCVVSAKYLSFEETDSNALLRVKRSDSSDDSSNSNEENSREKDDDDSENDDDNEDGELKDKIRRKALEHREKEKRRKEEEQRKLDEKQAKAHRKEEEKREKEERKHIEKLEKEKRKEEEKRTKEERKKQEKQRKELEKLEKEASVIKTLDGGLLETEEENSVELSDIWKEHIYVKYGLTTASTKLEKQATLNRYIEEELGLNQNSTERERYQAVIQLIKNKMQTDAAARTTLKNQLISHINAVSIQKLRADLDKDIEKLNNKSELLNNVSLPWAPLAKQQIEERRSFLQTISQFLSQILPNWLTGGQNVQKPNPSTVNRPVPEVSYESNAADGSNAVNVISDGSPSVGQANNDASTVNSDISPSANSSPATDSSLGLETVNEDLSGGNANENNKPSSTLAGSADINSVSTGNDDMVLVNSNTDGLSEGSVTTMINDITESINVVDNARPIDDSVVPPEYGDIDSSSASNNGISSNSSAAEASSLPTSSTIINNEGATSTSVSSEVSLTNPDVISTVNDETVKFEDNSSSTNSNKAPSGSTDVTNSANYNKPLSSGASSSNTSPLKPDPVSDISVDVSITHTNVPVTSEVVSTVNNVTVSVNNDNPSSNIAVNIGPSSTSTQEIVVTSDSTVDDVKPGTMDISIDVTSGSSGDNKATSINEANIPSLSNTANDPAMIPDTAFSDNSAISTTNSGNKQTLNVANDVLPQSTDAQENTGISDSTTDEVSPGIIENNVETSISVLSSNGNEASSFNNTNVPSTGNTDNASIAIQDAVISGNNTIAAAETVVKPTANMADNVVSQSSGTQETVVTSDNPTDVVYPIITENNVDTNINVISSGGNKEASVDTANVPSSSDTDTAPAETSDAAYSVNSDIAAVDTSATPTSNVASDAVPPSTITQETVVTSDNTTNEVSPIITENNVDTSINVISSDVNEASSVDAANVPSSSNTDTAPAETSDAVPSVNNDIAAVDTSATPTSNVASNAVPPSSDTQDNAVTFDITTEVVLSEIPESNVDSSIDVTSTGSNVASSANDANIPSTGTAPAEASDAAPSVNSDIAAVDTSATPTLNVASDAVPPSTITQVTVVTSDNTTNEVLPIITENNVDTNINVISSDGNEASSVDAANVPSSSNTDMPPAETSNAAPAGISNTVAADVGAKPTSNMADEVISQNSGTQENVITPDSTTDVVSPGRIENNIETNIDVTSSGGIEAPSDNAADEPSTSNTDTVPAETSDAAPSVNSDIAAIDTSAIPTSNVASDIVPSNTGTQENAVTSDSNINAILSGIPVSNVDSNIDLTLSANDENAPSTSTIDNAVSVANSEANNTDNGVQPISNVADSVNASDLGAIPSEGNSITPDYSANIPTSIANDPTVNAEPDVVKSDVSGDASVIAGNVSDTTVSSPISSVTGNVLSPNSSVVYADGNEVAINSASTNGTDVTSDASTSTVTDKGSEVPQSSVDAGSTTVTEGSSSVGTAEGSSPSNSGVSTNNDEILSSSVADNISPAITNEVTSIGSEASINDASSTGVESNAGSPVNTESIPSEVVPTESIINVSEVNDFISESNNVLSNSEAPSPATLAVVPSDPNVNDVDTTIAPEIIISVQTQDGTTVAQSVDIVTENPVDSGSRNEVGTPASEIINENTVVTTVSETSAPSEPPQVPTPEISLVDTESPVELPRTPLVIEGIIIPNEPGASIIEIQPQLQ